jgi:hypothetical protein
VLPLRYMPQRGWRQAQRPVPDKHYLYLPVYTGSTEMGSGATTTYSSCCLGAHAATAAIRPNAASIVMLLDI